MALNWVRAAGWVLPDKALAKAADAVDNAGPGAYLPWNLALSGRLRRSLTRRYRLLYSGRHHVGPQQARLDA
jgi:hypothetical protein